MILYRLRVQRFLALIDREFQFSRGINIIVGPNETGKSTLRTAIRTVLYANPGTTARQDFRSWGVARPPYLELEFEAHGTRYVLTKDFDARRVMLHGGGSVWDQHKKVQEIIARLLGLTDDKVFQTTAEVAQAELERVQLTSVSNELSRMLGGGEDVNTAIHKLESHLREMEKGLRTLTREPGVLRGLEDRVTALQAQLQRLTAQAAELERKQQDLAAIQVPLTDGKAALEAIRALVDTNRELLRKEQHLQQLRREEAMLADKVATIERTQQRLAEIGRQLEGATSAGVPEESSVRQARQHAERIAVLEEQVGRLRDFPPAQPAASSGKEWTWVSARVGGLLIAVGLLAWVAGSMAAAIVLGFLGVVTAGIGAMKRRRLAEAERLLVGMQQEREQQMRATEDQIVDERSALGDLLRRAGCSSLDEAERGLRAYQDLVKEREQAVKVLEATRASDTDEALRNRLDIVRVEVYGLMRELQDPDAAQRRLTPLQVQTHEGEVERLNQQVGQMDEQERRLRWEIEHRRTETEELSVIEEQLQEGQDTLAATRRRHDAYRVALDGMLEARRLIEKPVREVVATRAGEYLSTLSDGRYDRIEVEKDPLQVWVWSNDAKARVEPREPHLSRGTVDLVYLSLRIALVRALAEGRHPPLLLDDPFITFDDTRRQAAVRFLKELGQTHQIFLFTCTRYYNRDASTVIELTPRTVETAPEDEPTRPRTPVEARPVGPLWDQSR